MSYKRCDLDLHYAVGKMWKGFLVQKMTAWTCLSYTCSICKTREKRALLSLPTGVSLTKSCVAAVVLKVSRLRD